MTLKLAKNQQVCCLSILKPGTFFLFSASFANTASARSELPHDIKRYSVYKMNDNLSCTVVYCEDIKSIGEVITSIYPDDYVIPVTIEDVDMTIKFNT